MNPFDKLEELKRTLKSDYDEAAYMSDQFHSTMTFKSLAILAAVMAVIGVCAILLRIIFDYFGFPPAPMG